VIRFLDEPSPDRGYTPMTIDDALHIPPEERARVIAGYLPHEREARAKGVPMLGSGRIFMTAEEMITEDAPRAPEEWAKLWGVDFGIDHPFAAVLIGWDKETDIIHILHAIRMPDALIMQQARAMITVGAGVPVAWPHDGHVRDRNSGEPLARLYKNEGLLMLPEHAQWESGGISTEAGILEWDQREKNGKLKVARHLTEWLEERRFYHRKDGQIVKVKDDLMSATRIALMQKRSGKPVLLGNKRPGVGSLSTFAWGTPSHPGGDMDAFTGQ